MGTAEDTVIVVKMAVAVPILRGIAGGDLGGDTHKLSYGVGQQFGHLHAFFIHRAAIVVHLVDTQDPVGAFCRGCVGVQGQKQIRALAHKSSGGQVYGVVCLLFGQDDLYITFFQRLL